MTRIQNARNASRFLPILLAVIGAAADGRGETKVYTLDPSNHGNPEGIAADENTGVFFVGATGDGSIYRGTLDSPKLTLFIPGAPGKEAAGMKVAGGKLYVAGGFSGRFSVYDIATRKPLAVFQNFGAAMLNDLVVTKTGDVFITDSFVPRLWHFTSAQIAAGAGAPEGIPVDPEIQYDPSDFNLNGIVGLKGGRSLIVVQTNTGKLFRIDLDEHAPFGRQIHQIAVEPLVGGDGLLIDGADLLVVHSGILSFVRLNGDASAGRVIENRSDPSLRDPSTIARVKNYYLLVNFDFIHGIFPAGVFPPEPFTVTGLLRNYGDE